MLIDFEELKHKVNSSKWYGTEAWYEILNIISDCEDKTPRKQTGRWINRMPLYPSDVVKKCDVCGYETDTWRHCKFCPGCGAEMDTE